MDNLQSQITDPAFWASSTPAERPQGDVLARTSIQPVRWRDLSAVARLQQRAFQPRFAYRLPTLIMLLLTPGVRLLIARDGERITGCAIGDRLGGQCRIVNLCVDPDYRRRGIAARLLRGLELALPGDDMILMVQAENDVARALYLKEGYRESGRTRNYYGKDHDGIWMKKVRGAKSEVRGP